MKGKAMVMPADLRKWRRLRLMAREVVGEVPVDKRVAIWTGLGALNSTLGLLEIYHTRLTGAKVS